MPEPRVEPDRIAAMLRGHPSVEDCAVLFRESREGGPVLVVAYVVTSTETPPDRLREELSTRLTPGMVLDQCVPVSHLPLTDDGHVDERALSSLPVIDAGLARRWEERWRATPGIDEVAVVVHERPEPLAAPRRPDGRPADGLGVGPGLDTAVGGVDRARPRAISHGEPLRAEPGAPVLLPAVLERAARQHPEHGIVCVQPDGSETVLTYPALLDRCRRVMAGLRARGLRPGDHVIFQLESAEHFTTAFWACAFGGFVPVPIGTAPSYRELNPTVLKLQHAWHMLDRPLILTSAPLVEAMGSVSRLPGMDQLRAQAVEELALYAPDGAAHEGRPDDVALLLLTSGSSGAPKGVMQHHAALLARCAGTVQLNGFTSREVSLNWFPLDHVGGVVMFHLRDVYCGNVQVQAPTQLVLKDPLRWLDWIDRYRATVTWAPNFAFSMVNDRADEIGRRRWDLSSMRFILNAGEAIVARTARRFLEVLAPHGLPATAMRPAWGMSETCSAVTYSHRFTRASIADADPFVCVGTPIPGFSVRIVDARDDVVGEGTTGRLQVKGGSLTSGYFRNPTLNAESFTADGWFTTGDLGRIDDGQLTITGREKDVIIINGLNYYSHEIEATAEEVPGVDVSYVAACAVRAPGGDTDQIAIFFSATVSEDRRGEVARQIRAAVLRKIGVNPQYLVPVGRDDIPKTSIGKIQRGELRQRFARGEFAVAGRSAAGGGEPASGPGVVHRRRWRRREPAITSGALEHPIIFNDDEGLGAGLAARLEAVGVRPIRIEQGAGFGRLGPATFRIDPMRGEDYDRLFGQLMAEDVQPGHLVHLWTCRAVPRAFPTPDALQREASSTALRLLLLVQALARTRSSSTRLVVVSRQAQAVHDDEPVALEAGAMLGLFRTAAQEFPWLSCRHVDLPAGPASSDVESILTEMRTALGDREVAYRGGDRYVPRLERVPVPAETGSAFTRGGMYLITGGLGGVSAHIAAHLLTRYDARLLLVGRTPLSDGGPARGPRLAGDAITERMAAYEALRARGQVRYEAVDVADPAALRAAVDRAGRAWSCGLDGVVHQAGLFAERPLAAETAEGLTVMLRPKVAGTWALHELLAERPGGLLVASSSVNGVFGGFGVGAYAASNAALDSITQHRRSTGTGRTYTVAWSLWDEVGMSRGYAKKDLARGRGYRALAPPEALQALEAALVGPPGHVLVGLDDGNRHIRRQIEGAPPVLGGLRAYFTARGEPSAARPAGETVPDLFGTPTSCPGIHVPRLPRAADGSLDERGLRDTVGPGVTPATVTAAPRNELERVIAALWREVLGVHELGIEDNFFDLGGDSLRIAQLAGRLGEVLGRDISLTDLFEHPTISAVAAHLGGDGAPARASEVDRGDRRGEGRRERAVRRRRLQQDPGDRGPNA